MRFTFLEAVYTILVAVGGLTALIANRLGFDVLKTAGILVVFLGVVVFGLDMLVKRRAEIGTRYTSSVNPSFHVFRGYGAVAWGIVFVLAGLLFAGYSYISLTHWTSAQNFFGEHASIFIIVAGVLVTAWGFGSATKATYRHKDSEKPARRLADRLAAIVFIIPIGLCVLGWGILKTFAPAVAERTSTAIKGAALEWIEFFLK